MLALFAMMMLPQEQTTICQEELGRTVCRTSQSQLDGYASALGQMPSYSDEQLKRQQIESLRLQNQAARNAMRAPSRNAEWTKRCTNLALDILKVGQPEMADRLLDLCAR